MARALESTMVAVVQPVHGAGEGAGGDARRKPGDRSENQQQQQPDSRAPPQLSAGELKSMLGQCLQMASENKITAHNTWGLPLIEHLEDLIQDEGAVRRTNFQKASVTLDAGVKIYSYRVDSVHTETFKMLGGLGRAGIDGAEDGEGAELGDGGLGAKSLKKKRRGDLQPEATLESSLEALNVKKFDLAFAVDPLFHKTSAQFDEGGAHGLLLNNLSVYKGCNIVFDSMDVPDRAVGDAALEAAVDAASRSHSAACVREECEGVVGLLERNELEHARIAPVLDDITSISSTSNASNPSSSIAKATYPAGELVTTALRMAEATTAVGGLGSVDDLNSLFAAMHVPETFASSGDIIDSAGMDSGDVGGADCQPVHGEDMGYEDYGNDARDDGIDDRHCSYEHDQDALGEDAIHWLVRAGGDSRLNLDNAKNMSWTGASHWKYRMTAADGICGVQKKGSQTCSGNSNSRNVPEPLDFTILTDIEEPPRIDLDTSKRRKRAEKKTTAPDDSKTLLPQDFKYCISTLGKYNLRKEYIAILRGAGRGGRGDASGHGNDGNLDVAGDFGGDDDGFAYGPSDANGSFELNGGDDWAVGNRPGNVELAQASHKVEQIEVSYCKAAKQVDVKALKELMWRGITLVVEKRVEQGLENPRNDINFSDVLATVPADNHAGRIEDLSVHLCFICVLHLANEHGLVVQGVDHLDGLIIGNVPVAVAD